MTFADVIQERLVSMGMFDDQAREVMQMVKDAPENEAMQSRWNDDTSGYPEAMTSLIWATAQEKALVWIDQNCPKAWYRSMFEPQKAT